MTIIIKTLLLFVIVFIVLPCCNNSSSTGDNNATSFKKNKIDESKVVAKVNGDPIYIYDISKLLHSSKKKLTAKQALDALIDQQLLAQEAKNRGYYNHKETKNEKRNAIVKVLLNSIAQSVNVDTLNQEHLKIQYEHLKLRFVHGPKRKIVQAIILTGKNKFTPEESLSIAKKLATEVKEVTTKKYFVKIVEKYKEKFGKKIKIETLPSFSKETKKFLPSFVEKTFLVKNPQKSSKAFKTKYGWHVLFVIEETPAENITFSQAREIIAQEVTPIEQKFRVTRLIDKLINQANVFIYDDTINLADKTIMGENN